MLGRKGSTGACTVGTLAVVAILLLSMAGFAMTVPSSVENNPSIKTNHIKNHPRVALPKSPDTIVYVDPELSSAPVGSTITINISIANPVDLALAEITVDFMPSMLKVVEITKGDIFEPDTCPWPSEINNTAGYVIWGSGVSLEATAGVNNNGTLVVITFQVVAEGISILDMYYALLSDSTIKPLSYWCKEGYFEGLPSVKSKGVVNEDPEYNPNAIQDHPKMAANSDIHVVWQDNRSNNCDIYYKRSIDYGVSFIDEKKINTDSTAPQQFPDIAVSGNNVYVVWMDKRDGNWDIYLNKSIDSGVIWTGEKKVLTNSANQMFPSIAVFGDNVHITWVDDRNGDWDIYYTNSTDGGDNFNPETKINNDTGSANQYPPDIDVDKNNTAHIIWHDNRIGALEIYYAHSTNFNNKKVSDNNGMGSQHPSIAVNDSIIHIVYELYRLEAALRGADIYYVRSTDSGTSFGANKYIATLSDYFLKRPSVATQGNTVYTVYAFVGFTGEGLGGIYYVVSTNDGVSFSAPVKIAEPPIYYESLNHASVTVVTNHLPNPPTDLRVQDYLNGTPGSLNITDYTPTISWNSTPTKELMMFIWQQPAETDVYDLDIYYYLLVGKPTSPGGYNVSIWNGPVGIGTLMWCINESKLIDTTEEVIYGERWAQKYEWNVPDVGSYAVPASADLDGDGDPDLAIGIADGSVKFFRNDWGSGNPNWVNVSASWGSANIGYVGSYSAPALADLDDDGDYDLLIGTDLLDKCVGWENTGTTLEPAWTRNTTWDVSGVNRPAPAFADLDNDGDYDLLIGTFGGVSYAFNNTGDATSPNWTGKEEWNTPDASIDAVPALADLDKDNDYDLLIGSSINGGVAYENIGTIKSPNWTRKTNWDAPYIFPTSNAAPAFADLDNDENYDLLIGTYDGVSYGLKKTMDALPLLDGCYYNFSVKRMNSEGLWGDWAVMMFRMKPSGVTLSLNEGWNFITLPLNTTYERAEDLAQGIDNCTYIGRWNATSFLFESHKKGTNENNFTIDDGYGYFVYVEQSTSFVLNGDKITGVTMNLNVGWNSIGRFNSTSTDAKSLILEITNCTAIAYWNSTLGRFITHPVDTGISNFTIERGGGYLVYIVSPTVWVNH